MLHEEIERLPERFRTPLVLCDLEDRSHEQAARHLGWPVGTVKSRQARGRERLRDRLVRRGLAPSAGLLAAMPRLDHTHALVPSALVDSTTSAALQFAAGGTLVPGSAVLLAQGVLRSMSIIQWLKVASVVLILVATATGVDVLTGSGTSGAEPQAEGNLKPARGDGVQGSAVKPDKLRLTVAERGLLEASENDGRVLPGRGEHDHYLDRARAGRRSRRASSSASSTHRGSSTSSRTRRSPRSRPRRPTRMPSSPARLPRSPLSSTSRASTSPSWRARKMGSRRPNRPSRRPRHGSIEPGARWSD